MTLSGRNREMVASPDRMYLTPQEYLVWEEQQALKYEYINGEVVAMTGGTVAHGTIAANLFFHIKSHLRGSRCRPFVFDVKLGISENGPFHYPDVMVSCDDRDRDATNVIYHPCFIAEVLSPSTEAFDRGKKFQNYRNIETLQEYVLLDATQMSVECFRRMPNYKWELTSYIAVDANANGQEIEVFLSSLEFKFPIAFIYEDVRFEESS